MVSTRRSNTEAGILVPSSKPLNVTLKLRYMENMNVVLYLSCSVFFSPEIFARSSYSQIFAKSLPREFKMLTNELNIK